MAEKRARGRIKGMLLFIPNLLGLLGRLMTDGRVPRAEKVFVAAAIVYAISPLDFIPDMIPFVGQIDDAYMIALTLLRLVNRADESIVREHWRGGGDVVKWAESVASLAPRFLPRRAQRVLEANVEMQTDAVRRAEGREFRSSAVLVVELPEEKEERPALRGEG